MQRQYNNQRKAVSSTETIHLYYLRLSFGHCIISVLLTLSFGHYIVSALLTASVWSLYCLCSTYAFVWTLYCLCTTYGFRLVIVLSQYYLRFPLVIILFLHYLRLPFGHCIVSVLLTAFVWSLYCLCTAYGFPFQTKAVSSTETIQ
jgi:hypothetical protein